MGSGARESVVPEDLFREDSGGNYLQLSMALRGTTMTKRGIDPSRGPHAVLNGKTFESIDVRKPLAAVSSVEDSGGVFRT